MESFATGLKRIQDACDEAGCKVEYYGDNYGFTVRFYRHCGEGWGELVQHTQINAQVNAQANAQVDMNQGKLIENIIIAYCSIPRTMKEIQARLGFKNRRSSAKYVKQLLEKQVLTMSSPDKPNHPKQKYISLIK